MEMNILKVIDIKPIGKVGKNLLKDENPDKIIEYIIEKPLQKVCKDCRKKNIETVMSSANRNNVMKNDSKVVYKKDVINRSKKTIMQTFERAGKGYVWLMINYNTLSDENREIFFSLEKELGEEVIWFVKSNYVEGMNVIRRKLRLKELTETYNDKYADRFKEKQILLMYNNNYPRRVIFIRMPVNKDTNVEDVENFFGKIISKLVNQ